MKLPLNASQTISVLALSAALAAGAYAVGRSQGTPAVTPPPEKAAPAVAAAAPPAAEPIEAPKPGLCADCLRVLSVRTEQHKAESGSGIGAVGGAVIGGLLGNRIGGGNGRKLATVGGAVAGGYAGNEIEKNTSKKTVWVVELERPDGTRRHRTLGSDPHLQAGDVVNAQLKRR